jgi:DNA-directed RNA polymerase specialized sigma24 family protein
VIAETTPGARRGPGIQLDPVDVFYRDRFADAVRLAHLLSGDASVAEDLAQDAFERVRHRRPLRCD